MFGVVHACCVFINVAAYKGDNHCIIFISGNLGVGSKSKYYLFVLRSNFMYDYERHGDTGFLTSFNSYA